MKRRLVGWCEMAASLGASQLKVSLLREDLLGARTRRVGKEPPFREDLSTKAE
jgi:hypothetical protein